MYEPSSEIIDFYPTDFEVDVEGKRYAWMGEVILPFIEEERLLAAIEKRFDQLTEYELKKNQLGKTYIFMNREGQTGTQLQNKVKKFMGRKFKDLWIEHKDVGIVGKINISSNEKRSCKKPFENLKIDDVENNIVDVYQFDSPPKIVIFQFYN